jgi:hypothetical protein
LPWACTVKTNMVVLATRNLCGGVAGHVTLSELTMAILRRVSLDVSDDVQSDRTYRVSLSDMLAVDQVGGAVVKGSQASAGGDF